MASEGPFQPKPSCDSMILGETLGELHQSERWSQASQKTDNPYIGSSLTQRDVKGTERTRK